MSSKTLWKTLRSSLSLYGEIIRVENPACPGTPDVVYCLQGVTGWIELKVVPREPKGTTPLKIRDLTIQQRIWIRNWHLANGRVYLLIRCPGLYLLINGGFIHLMDKLTIKEIVNLKGTVVGTSFFPSMDILKELTNGT